MKVTEGHLTPTNISAIKAILSKGLTEGRVGVVDYFIKKKDDKAYEVTMRKKDRGMIPVPGSPLRVSTYKAKFTL